MLCKGIKGNNVMASRTFFTLNEWLTATIHCRWCFRHVVRATDIPLELGDIAEGSSETMQHHDVDEWPAPAFGRILGARIPPQQAMHGHGS